VLCVCVCVCVLPVDISNRRISVINVTASQTRPSAAAAAATSTTTGGGGGGVAGLIADEDDYCFNSRRLL